MDDCKSGKCGHLTEDEQKAALDLDRSQAKEIEEAVIQDPYLSKDPDPRKWFPGNLNIPIGVCFTCGQSITVCRGTHGRLEIEPIPSGEIKPQPMDEIETTKEGGKQSKLRGVYVRYPHATNKVAEISRKGADKYGEDNWLGISLKSHLDHALYHIHQHLSGDTSEEHLAHAATRLMMALENECTQSS